MYHLLRSINHVFGFPSQPTLTHGLPDLLLDQAEMVHRADGRPDGQGKSFLESS